MRNYACFHPLLLFDYCSWFIKIYSRWCKFSSWLPLQQKKERRSAVTVKTKTNDKLWKPQWNAVKESTVDISIVLTSNTRALCSRKSSGDSCHVISIRLHHNFTTIRIHPLSICSTSSKRKNIVFAIIKVVFFFNQILQHFHQGFFLCAKLKIFR